MADVEWWTVYADTLLQDLIITALEYNKDMLIASERVKEMQFKYRMDKAGQWPSFRINAPVEHEWENYGGNKPTSAPEIVAKLALSWEIDLWGNLRWASRQGAAEYLSSVEAQRAMQMTIVAEVATAYFELVALDNQLEIVRQTVVTRQEGVKQAKLRFEGGMTSETSYQQAQVELATASADIPELERRIAVKESLISLLCGLYPDKVARQQSKLEGMDNASMPVGLPSDLLLRRPDLRQAEAKLKAAEAAVGVAQAERFPTLVINLQAGFENDDFKTFLKSPLFYAAGNIVAPLFSFGKRKAKFKAAVSAYNQERLRYEKKVLTAFKEVHDAIIDYHSTRENTVLMRELRDATEKYVDLAQLQYLNGLISYLDVLDAYRKFYSSQIGLNTAVRNENLALITLYKALGGGWAID